MRALLVVVTSLAVLSCGREGFSNAKPNIDVQQLAVDFGPVPVGIEVSASVVIRNQGRAELVLDPAVIEGMDFGANTESVTIPGGSSAQLDITFRPSVEGLRDGKVKLSNNSENDSQVDLVVTGQGIPRLVCADCNSPPMNYCASSAILITYQPHGSCVNNRCEYQATTTICGGTCVAASNACSAPMGQDAGVDAGVTDAGVDAGVADAGVDAGMMTVDAGPSGVYTTPGVMTFTVPPGVRSITVEAWGGGGAGGEQVGSTGGGAAFGRATFSVNPNEDLEVRVAEGGRPLGAGGGASSLWRGTTALLVVAGGGGGGSDGNSGSYNGGRGGAGGATQGQAGSAFIGTIFTYCTSATGGQGGTQTAGGLAGSATGSASNVCSGQPGAALGGGRATGVNNTCDMGLGAQDWRQGGGQGNGGGGGGGSGWFGGGGAGFIWTYCAGGGGGGSSYAAATATAVTLTAGSDRVQGNAAGSAGAGAGGFDGVGGRPMYTNSAGKDGRVVITW
jgi:hypothetical protein